MYLWNRTLFEKRLRALGVIPPQGERDRRITAKRAEGQLSVRDLAGMCGWQSHTLLVRIINETTNTVEDRKAVRLAFILGVGVDDLFETRSSTATQQTATRKTTRKVAA